jgi:hypothetical protein
MITPRFHTATELGDLARQIDHSEDLTECPACSLKKAVLELEAYTEQQVAKAIAEAKRRWPEDWTERLHDGLVEEEIELSQAAHFTGRSS